MKTFIVYLVVLLAFASCEDKVKDVDKFTFDSNATILIRPDKSINARSLNAHLSALEIVQQTANMSFYSNYFDNTYQENPSKFNRGFSDMQRDFDLPALKMFGSDIIRDPEVYADILKGKKYIKDFIHGYDFVLTSISGDTIAYIPNAVITEARSLIITALETDNYEYIYEIFHEAFTFIPITAEEYRDLTYEENN